MTMKSFVVKIIFTSEKSKQFSLFFQVLYAARDAMSAICILMELVELKNTKRKGQMSETDVGKWVASFCQGLVDIKYSEKSQVNMVRMSCHVIVHFTLVSIPNLLFFHGREITLPILYV